MLKIGFITGLKSEAEILAPFVDETVLRTTGMQAGAAARCAHDLVAQGCKCLVSFGLAGGLISGLRPGDVIVAHTVIAPNGKSYAAHLEMTADLLRSIPGAQRLSVAGSDTIVADSRDKKLLRERSGAGAVDMESHHVARCADELGVGFVVVRAVTDTVTASLPSAALGAVDIHGETRVGSVLARLALRPWEIVALVRLAAASRAAHAGLGRVAPMVVGCADRL